MCPGTRINNETEKACKCFIFILTWPYCEQNEIGRLLIDKDFCIVEQNVFPVPEMLIQSEEPNIEMDFN